MAGKFVIALSESAAGCLRDAGAGDRFVAVTDDLTESRCPAADDPAEFARQRLATVQATLGPYELETFTADWAARWLRELEACRSYAEVDIWADPNPAAQLRLLYVLHALGRARGGIEGVGIVHAHVDIGSLEPDKVGRLARLRQPLNDRQATLAEAAWSALRAPTPERWAGLLKQSLSALPYLDACVRRLLDELPASGSGLTRTQARLLSVIAAGELRPYPVFAAIYNDPAARLLGYWELGRALDRLADPAAPLILGLAEGPFTVRLHQDAPRLTAYKASALQPTKLGRAILDGRDDYARLARFDHWWGGTHLTRERLWRWNAAAASLVAPAGYEPPA